MMTKKSGGGLAIYTSNPFMQLDLCISTARINHLYQVDTSTNSFFSVTTAWLRWQVWWQGDWVGWLICVFQIWLESLLGNWNLAEGIFISWEFSKFWENFDGFKVKVARKYSDGSKIQEYERINRYNVFRWKKEDVHKYGRIYFSHHINTYIQYIYIIRYIKRLAKRLNGLDTS